MIRYRIWAAALTVLLALLGYWARFVAPIGDEMRDRSGGALYVLFWIVLVAAFIPRASAFRIAGAVLIVTCLLEFAQLWHPPWLEAIRSRFIGRAVLGTTFDWSDFPAYIVGALAGWLTLAGLQRGWARTEAVPSEPRMDRVHES